MAPVLETEHEAVEGGGDGAGAGGSGNTAMVVSTRGTLDDDEDDFFN